MQGTGVPLATPFRESGDLDEARLRELVGWLVDRDVDFLVPCGSNSEAELMTLAERARVVEVVVDAAPADVPVLAGAGHPGLRETREQVERAAAAGADGVLVVTPFYYRHDQDALRAYYRSVADASPIPVYLYDVPKYTGVSLDPDTVGALADHETIMGMKDSTGDLARLQGLRARAPDLALLVGSGGVYASGLDLGADGGVLAVGNVAPEVASSIHAHHATGDAAAARDANRRLVELNHAVTAGHGVPGLKAAMRARGAPAGHVRSPHRPLDADARKAVAALVRDVLGD